MLRGQTLLGEGTQIHSDPGALIQYEAGKVTFEPNLSISANTSNRITGSVEFAGSVDLPSFELASGGAVSGAFTNRGVLNWSGGVLGPGDVTFAPGSIVYLTTDADKLFHLVTLRNAGTVYWDGGRLVNWGNDHRQNSTITNLAEGVWRIRSDQPTAAGVSWSGYRPGQLFWNNQGTFIKESSSGQNSFDSSVFENNGSLVVSSGSILFRSLQNRGEIIGATDLKPLGFTGAGFRLQLTGSAGLGFAISFSTNLTTWNGLLTTNSPGGAFEVIDASAPRTGQRFYRGALVPVPY